MASKPSGIRPKVSLLPHVYRARLTFLVLRYASDLTPEQKDALLDVIRASPHPQISPEIRRELVNSVARDAPRVDPNQDVEMS